MQTIYHKDRDLNAQNRKSPDGPSQSRKSRPQNPKKPRAITGNRTKAGSSTQRRAHLPKPKPVDHLARSANLGRSVNPRGGPNGLILHVHVDNVGSKSVGVPFPLSKRHVTALDT